MIVSFIRKAAQVIDDPVLRRWLIGRAMGKFPGEPTFTAHRPPYLKGALPLAAEPPNPPTAFSALGPAAPSTTINLPLPGLELTLNPGEEHGLFSRDFADTETLLAVHRFAWLPLLKTQVDPAWVNAIWNAWLRHHGAPDDGWAWHPYTAAERAINILHFARTHGLPGKREETLDCLAGHATVIADRLEYFGDHHTSNHLTNNGRGLFLIGLWLGLPTAADLGGVILVAEAARIFLASGMLREGSSHYHILLAKNYAEATCEAETHGRDEAPALRRIADKATAVAAALVLPGGLPLIGDISPDYPPQRLLEDFPIPPVMPALAQPGDGWLRHDHGSWSGLWHVSPQGWRHMPGHGHEDCGGFELHFDGTPLFVDPGRGSYGKTGDVACSGAAHNTVLVDGQDPYPPNRPYYDDRFRHLICGDGPKLEPTETGVRVIHHGFSRLGGVGVVNRYWSFGDNSLCIDDSVEGGGTHAITRLLVTPLAAELVDDAVFLKNTAGDFRVTASESRLSLRSITRWTAYGDGVPAMQIFMQASGPLPWSGKIVVEKI